MFDIGFSELLVCAVIALVVLGPERLPEAARTLGRWVGKARRFTAEITSEFERQLDAKDLKQKLQEESEKLGLDEIRPSSLHAMMDERYNATPLVEPPDDFPEEEEVQPPPLETASTVVPHPRLKEGEAASARQAAEAPELPVGTISAKPQQ